MQLPILQFRRMGQMAYTALRDAILAEKLEPGERLNQDELAKRLGVSRAPVRDALSRLEAEGLIQAASRKGFMVAPMTPTDLKNIFELRGLLDSHCARLAAATISDADLNRLQQLVEETARHAASNDLNALVRVHAEFHYVIYAACGNPELERLARNLWDRSYRFRVMGLREPVSTRSSAAHHAVLQALQEHDPERAARQMAEENRLIIERLQPLLEARVRKGIAEGKGEAA